MPCDDASLEKPPEPGHPGELMPLVYEHLRSLALSFLSGRRKGHTLQPTALVHEAYVRIAGSGREDWQGRAHFFAVAARAMRQVLVNHAEARGAAKRGGDWSRVTLSDVATGGASLDVDILALNEALERLEALDERQVRIVEMRFFGGLTMEEIAAMLEVSLSTIEKDWRMARSWLRQQLDA